MNTTNITSSHWSPAGSAVTDALTAYINNQTTSASRQALFAISLSDNGEFDDAIDLSFRFLNGVMRERRFDAASTFLRTMSSVFVDLDVLIAVLGFLRQARGDVPGYEQELRRALVRLELRSSKDAEAVKALLR